MIKIICISDTHTMLSKVKLPEGDLLIHSGDATFRGNVTEMIEFNSDLEKIKNKYRLGILYIPGNHDALPDLNPDFAREIITNATILIHEAIEIEGIKIFGSPYTPTFFNWYFMKDRGQQIKEKWEQIPEDTNILITHGAPMGILDMVPRGIHAGCEELHKRVFELKDLRLHVFGHLHSGNNKKYGGIVKQNDITFINAAICNEEYKPIQKAHEFIYDIDS